MAVDQILIPVRTAYVFFPMAIGFNAMLWITCSAIWRLLRRASPKASPYRYSVALAVAGLAFLIANTIHFLRPVTCGDCSFPYGVPFTLYHDGSYSGGAGFVWSGLAADIGCVLVAAIIFGRIWETVAKARGSEIAGASRH